MQTGRDTCPAPRFNPIIVNTLGFLQILGARSVLIETTGVRGRRRSGGDCSRIFCRCAVSQRTVWARGVVILPPGSR